MKKSQKYMFMLSVFQMKNIRKFNFFAKREGKKVDRQAGEQVDTQTGKQIDR